MIIPILVIVLIMFADPPGLAQAIINWYLLGLAAFILGSVLLFPAGGPYRSVVWLRQWTGRAIASLLVAAGLAMVVGALLIPLTWHAISRRLWHRQGFTAKGV